MTIDIYQIIRTLHILSSTILFGTGIAIAFFMYRTHFTNNLSEKLYVAKGTVLADYLFTLPAVIIQPATGIWLIYQGGSSWTDLWLVITYALYFVAGVCWLPVVWIQIELKKILIECVTYNMELPERYYILFKIWFILGWPAFIGLVVIYFLMVLKPV